MLESNFFGQKSCSQNVSKVSQKQSPQNDQNKHLEYPFWGGSSIQLLSDAYFGIFLDRTSFTDQSSMFQKLLKMAQIYGGA